MSGTNPNDPKQQEAHAAGVREKALRDRTLPAIQSWPIDPVTGEPMAVAVAMASDLIPTVPFGNVTIQSTIMRPLPMGRELTDAEVALDIENARKVQKAAEFVVGTERRLLQWALDPASRIVNPITQQEFTGAGEQPGGAPPAAPSQQSQPPPPAASTTGGAGSAQAG